MSYSDDWITYRGHRVYLNCRSGFPHDDMTLAAQVGTYMIDQENQFNTGMDAAIVEVFHDYKNGVYVVEFAATDKRILTFAERFTDALQGVFGPMIHARCSHYAKSDVRDSDHYHHGEYLWECHSAAGVSAIDWKIGN